jgi:hypothetical protein
LIPLQQIIQDENPENGDHIQSAVAEDRSFVLVYLAKGQTLNLDLSEFNNLKSIIWFNPREGKFMKAGKIKNHGVLEFTPPSSGIGNDWMLVLE